MKIAIFAMAILLASCQSPTDKRLDELNSRFDELNSRIDDLEGSLKDLTEQVETLQNNCN